MRLQLENGTVIDNPTAVEIAEALGSLHWATDNSFAILEREEWTYIQTAQQDDPEFERPFFVLEYQEGSLDRHFQAVDGPFALERVIEAFQKYATKDQSWRGDFKWARMELGQ